MRIPDTKVGVHKEWAKFCTRRRDLQTVNFITWSKRQFKRSILTVLGFSRFGNEITKQDLKHNRHPRSVPALFWNKRNFVSSHLNHCFLHPYPTYCLLRRAASVRDRKQQTKSWNRTPVQKQLFSKKMCLILIFPIRLIFHLFGYFGVIDSKNQRNVCWPFQSFFGHVQINRLVTSSTGKVERIAGANTRFFPRPKFSMW